MGLLQRILVLGALPLGVIGAWRFGRPLESTRARLVATVVYVSIPLAANSLARGRWPGLVAYAVAPWLVGGLARATGLEPWATPGELPRRVPTMLRLGLLLAVAGAFVPSLALVAVAVALGLVLGSVLVGGTRAALRSLTTAVGAVGVGFALLFPWSLHFVLPGREWAAFAGAAPSPAHAPGFGALLRFHIGPVGGAPLGWAFVVVAALPLLIGRGWRLAWAVRLWAVALVCVAVAWAGGRGWVLSGVQLRDAMLGPAALALAGAAAVGMIAFQTDLTRVATFPIANDGSNRPYKMIDVAEGHHDLSHHGQDPKKLEKIAKINTFHVRQVAYLLERMKAVKEANGTCLLDNVMVVYGSGIGDGNRHNHDDLPVLLLGKGGGTVEGGRHLAFPKRADTPLMNLYLSLFDRMGAPTERFGDSTGRLPI